MSFFIDPAGNFFYVGKNRSHQQKLIAAIANGKDLFPHDLLDAFGFFLQHLVSEFVSALIIHLLKIIDIND